MPENQSEKLDANILSIDIAVGTTGYAVYSMSTKTFNFKIVNVGVIETESKIAIDTRIRSILGSVGDLIWRYKINFVVIEQPPETIYGSKFMSKNGIIGRASSIFKVMAACYAIVGMCYSMNLFCRVVFPVQWQNDILKPTGDKSKRSSIANANRIFAHLKYSKRLKTKKDENTADAVNIGFFAVKSMHAKKWAVPNLGVGYGEI